jgi:hypothetical protein
MSQPHDVQRPPAGGPAGELGGDHDDAKAKRIAAPFAQRLAWAQQILEGLPESQEDNPVWAEADRLVMRNAAALTGLRPDRQFWPAPLHGDGHRQRTYALAGLLACEPCEHVEAKTCPGPVTALLTYRRVDCPDCASQWATNASEGALWVPPVPAVPEDRCDLCDEIAPDGMFTPVMCSLGIFVIGGDACRDCVDVIVGPKDCCDVVIGGEIRFEPYEDGRYELINERTVAMHDEDCDWHDRYRSDTQRATNRAQRRAAMKRSRRKAHR